MSCTHPSIAIIGAGLSGLACARMLARAGQQFTLYEAAHEIGGRFRTDSVDGFLLDRGFQPLLPAYPEAQRVLDYEGLKLRPFYRGVDVFYKNRFHRLSDPLSHFGDAVQMLRDPFVSRRDHWLNVLLRKEVRGISNIERRLPEIETEDYLRSFGFSESFIDRCFRSFLGSLFLEKDLRTSVRQFLFQFAMLCRGGLALPAHGIRAIPDQLAVALPPGSLCLNSAVETVRPGGFTLANGENVNAEIIILAVGEESAARMLGDLHPEKLLPARSTTCLYFATDQDLPHAAILHLDGDGRGPVNHACVLSKVSPDYAPAGQHLIAASILGSPSSHELEEVVREQMTRWFGPGARQWRHLRTYSIRNALPESRQLHVGNGPLPHQLAPGLFRCGDYIEDATLNGALRSGRRTAEMVLESLT